MTPDILGALAELMAGDDRFDNARVGDGELLVTFDGVNFAITAEDL